MSLISCSEKQTQVEYASFDEYPIYEDNDLGVSVNEASAKAKIWSPAAESVKIRIYDTGLGSEAVEEKEMRRGESGTWSTELQGDYLNKYYTFQIKQDGQWLGERPDVYAKAVGANGMRGMFVDMAATDPEGWENDIRPPIDNYGDILLYELHIRDLSTHPNSGIENKGKFLGLTESGTKSPDGLSTGLDHIKELGATHIHLLPSFDFRTIDETTLEKNDFNWGYDPQNYNTPEGSYSTNPSDGKVRIKEFKKMVQTLHDNGLRVVMDVVYNHTGETEKSVFNTLVPGYYYRQNEDGTFSDASACGNETASDRTMMRKYMVESVKYWVEEYHVDGFRFDLMGIHDIETMNMISEELRKIDPTIFIYGEGWTAGSTPLPQEKQAIKANTHKLDSIAAFSDDIRDGLKGPWSNHEEPGFVSGKEGLKESIKFGIVASTQHPQIDYEAVNYSNAPWASEPYQTITYVSCHDNHTLYDKLKISNPEASEEKLIDMHKLAITTVLTSQGIPFLHAGTELLRTKDGEENSYKSPDLVNQLDWTRKSVYKDLHDYYQALIRLRKSHPAFRMQTNELIQKHIEFLDTEGETLVAYVIKDNANGDEWKNILVILNGGRSSAKVGLPEGNWNLALNKAEINENGISIGHSGSVSIKGTSAIVLFQELD